MVTFSLCMIVKDEDLELRNCLNSVKDAFDEIIIVSTADSKSTEAVARNFTDKVYNFKWIDDFSAARNFSYSKATMDYIMWLDADDIMMESDCKKLLELKNTLEPTVDIVMMKYNHIDPTSGKVYLSYFRERLSRRVNNYTWQEPIHEYLSIGGNILHADMAVVHSKLKPNEKNRNLLVYEKYMATGKELTPRGLFYYSKELYYNEKYDKAAEGFQKFLDDGKGWIEDNITSCELLSKCYGQLKNDEKKLKALLRAMEYDNPRANICCEIGYHYKNIFLYDKAAFWFELARTRKIPENNLGLVYMDCYDFIPCIELCVCNDNMGREEEAIRFNLKAGEYKPNNSQVLYNKNYYYNKSLSSRLKQLGIEKDMLRESKNLLKGTEAGEQSGITFFAIPKEIEELEGIVSTFLDFDLQNKELIIFLYTANDFAKIASITNQYKFVKIVNVSSDFTNKNCADFVRNTATYDYVAKINGIDFYAETYARDILNALNVFKCDVVTKGEYFAYNFEKNKLSMVNRDKFHFLGKKVCKDAWAIRKEILEQYVDDNLVSKADNNFEYQNVWMECNMVYLHKFDYAKIYDKEELRDTSDFIISEDWKQYVLSGINLIIK